MKPLVVLLAATVAMPDFAQLERMSARFAPVKLNVDTSALSAGDRQALGKLMEAARILNFTFLDQLWSGNRAMYEKLEKDTTALGKARLAYFWLNKGPWSSLDGYTAFVPGAPARKPLGANFYPEDMSREEFEQWVKTLSADRRREAESFFTVIRRDGNGRLTAIPYSQAYHSDLARVSALLRQAAAVTDNASLKKYLTLRADAFLSNDYYASDIAWMELDAPLDITIGPYETYNDELFGYKAAFEAYITLRDDKESARLQALTNHLQEIENSLPIEAGYRNPKLASLAPIRVVNEVLAAGDGAHGVRTAAFNLPNDERVVQQKGAKRVMLKNIQEAKFRTILAPIGERVLAVGERPSLSFDSFFLHILAHELSHGIGPQQIHVAGRVTSARQELKDLYATIEEAKADVTGLFMLQYLYDHGLIPHAAASERQLYTTYLASTFRSVRFGLTEAHARGTALQFNYFTDKGGFVANADGTFRVDFAKIKSAVRDLDHDLLTIEAQGDYQGAKKLLDSLAVVRPPMQKALDRMKDIPTDIDPVNE
ncbi:MAG TPA: hypothetical protein VKV17_00140 [Bryobacteraceae bacterium]|nr:hypothetical protein [Bryobacteraceae bacterium]